MSYRMTLLLLVGLALVGCSKEAPESSVETSAAAPVAAHATAGDWLAAAVAEPAFVAACEATPGCEPPHEAGPADTQVIWRMVVRRTADGEVVIGPPARVTVAAGNGLPLAPPDTELTLIGLDADGEVLSSRGLRFPSELRLEYAGGRAPHTISLDKHAVDTMVYLPANAKLARVEIREAGGRALASRDLPPPAAQSGQGLLRWLGVEAALADTGQALSLPPHCAHIAILQGEADRALGEGMQWGTASSLWNEWLGEDDSIRLVPPGPFQLAATQAALSRMTPLLCQSVSRIAFGVVPTSRLDKGILGAVASASAGDMIVINANDNNMAEEALAQRDFPKLQLQTTLTHEAGHAAETLLTIESSAGEPYHGQWNEGAHTLASETVDNVRLEVGLAAEWGRMHESFQQQGWAAPYGMFPEGTKEKPATWKPIDVMKGGFISRYASDGVFEDIADHVAWPYMSRLVRDAYAANNVGENLREDIGCLEMRKYTERNLPSDYAAVYTKLHFLQDLGLVWPQGVKDCTGETLGLHIEDQGFHVWQKGKLLRSFDKGLTAHLGTTGLGAKVFELEAGGAAEFSGKSYPAQVKLRIGLGGLFDDLDRLSWPRGVYPLGLEGNNNLQLRLDGAPAGNFDVMDGFVLVAESSARRIAGSAVIQRVMRLQAPLPVPELYDPPLVMRFMIEK